MQQLKFSPGALLGWQPVVHVYVLNASMSNKGLAELEVSLHLWRLQLGQCVDIAACRGVI